MCPLLWRIIHVTSAIFTVSSEFTFGDNSLHLFLNMFLDLTGRDLTVSQIHSDPEVSLAMNNQLTRGADKRNQTVLCSIAVASQFTAGERLIGLGHSFLKTLRDLRNSECSRHELVVNQASTVPTETECRCAC